MKKQITALVVLIVVLVCAVSCNNGPNEQNSNVNDNKPDTETAPLINDQDDIPEMNFNGREFRIVDYPDYGNAHGNLVEAEQTGDVLNDAIYMANTNVEERFNLVFKEINCPGSYTEAYNLMTKSVLAAEDAYDYVLLTERDSFALAVEGKYFYSFDELPYVDLRKDYWDQAAQKSLSIGNKVYFTYGSNMLSAFDFSTFLVFNKQIADNLALDNFYQLVRNGKWTIDKFYTTAKSATLDVNGDGVMNNDDQYGIVSRGDYFYASFWVTDRVPLIAKDSDDLPYFNVPGNDKLFAIFEKLHMISTSECLWEKSTGDTIAPRDMFSKGNALFFTSTTFVTQYFRNMEIDYGIIPYPTLDEKKPGDPYSMRVQGFFAIVVPITADPVCGSVVMEALACQYYKNVVPTFYDLVVQAKGTRDEESCEMLDMLFSNMYLDLGDSIWTAATRWPYTEIFFKRNGDTVVSMTASIEDSVNSTLQEAINMFKNLDK
ncbi:MAG: hypothetical protein FWF15_08610 [Oscillospiraceae bacterium]|nr:hypothetical protein [Oscillospiraceae bacterium]